MTPLSPAHSPELVDNLYFRGVHSTDTATTSAFMVYIYIPDSSANDIVNILSEQLDEMQKEGAQTSSDNLNNTMTMDPLTDTHLTTYLDDDRITHDTNITSRHLEGVPHAYIATLPTLSPTTYRTALDTNRRRVTNNS